MKGTQKPILAYSELSDNIYICTRYKVLENGVIVASRRFDITDQIVKNRKAINRVLRKYKAKEKKK